MANAPARGGKKGGEILQFAILILFMTSGGLALMSAVFYLFLIPSRHDRLLAQIKDSNSLVELLEKKNNAKTRIWDLRRSYNEAAKNPSTKTLKQIVEENLGGLGWSSFPPTQTRPKGNTVEHIQTIDLKDAALTDIFQFAARVKQENPSVQVGHLNLTRRARTAGLAAATAGPDEEKWSAKLEFFTYTTTGPGSPGAGKASPPPPAEAPPSELPPEEPPAPEPPPAEPKAEK